MRLSASQLATLRTRPQSTKLYLSIFQPRIVFQAKVNGSISKGEREIPFDSVSLGAYTDIVPNATMWIGTSAGAKDIGKIRVRSATSSVITVSENQNIEWADNQDLTVFYYIELWPVYPRIITNPSDDEDVIFYKDWDIAYSNQNSILGTFVNAGPHRATFAGNQLYYSSTGTYNLLENSLSYSWTFEGGSPASSTSADPGYVTYNTPGHYVTRLIVTGSNGTSDTTYRYVSIYNPIGQGSNTPVIKWEMTSLSGSRDEGGFRASFKVYEDVEIQENAVVVLFADDWYGSSNQSFGGNYPNAEKIFFVGYVLDGSIHYDYQHSYVSFSVASLTQLMKDALGFSVSVESVSNPNVWYKLLDMDCRRAIYHYLRWHTTALQIGDFQFVGDDRKIQFFDADRNSMYDAIDNLMRGTLVGKVVSDRQGKAWMEVDAKAYSNPTGSFTSVMDITKRDWMGEPSIDERFSDEMSFLELGGIAYSGISTGTFAALLGSAPGNTPSFRGTIDTREGLALVSQAQLNQLVGNVWANENSKYPRINMDMGINVRNLDIAPQETTNIVIAASDTVRNIPIQGLYVPAGMNWKYDAKSSLLVPSIDFQNVVTGNVGQTIDVPIIDNGFNVPDLDIPPLPPLTVPFYSIPSGSISVIVQTEILAFQADYGTRTNALSASRNVTIGPVSITNGVSSIQMTMTKPGLYAVHGYFGYDSNGGTAGLETDANFQIQAGGTSFQNNFRALYNGFGGARNSGSLSGVVFISGGVVLWALTIFATTGTVVAPDYYGLSIVRVSA